LSERVSASSVAGVSQRPRRSIALARTIAGCALSSISAISAPRVFGPPNAPSCKASAKFWKLAGALPVHCRIASAAHCGVCFA